jgi:hypothetical protein
LLRILVKISVGKEDGTGVLVGSCDGILEPDGRLDGAEMDGTSEGCEDGIEEPDGVGVIVGISEIDGVILGEGVG